MKAGDHGFSRTHWALVNHLLPLAIHALLISLYNSTWRLHQSGQFSPFRFVSFSLLVVQEGAQSEFLMKETGN